MSRIEKILERWSNSKQEALIDEVYKILDHYFSGNWYKTGKGGSHNIRVQSDLLKGKNDFGVDGDFTIPVKGRLVKYYYLRNILKAIEIIEEEEDENEEY